MKGKVAMITGGSSGIGLACARRFASAGARVAIVGRDEPRCRAAIATLDGPQQHSFHLGDMGIRDDVERTFDAIVDRHGRVDFAFNNAGAAGPAVPFLELGDDAFERLMAVNAFGTYWCMKRQVAHMLDNGGGAIVNCASIGGIVGAWDQSGYVASKHAVVGLTRAVGLEYAARNVRVNAICPGGVDTPLLRSYLAEVSPERRARFAPAATGRVARPDEIAGTVLFLCSDDAVNVVGQAWAVDGGLTAA